MLSIYEYFFMSIYNDFIIYIINISKFTCCIEYTARWINVKYIKIEKQFLQRDYVMHAWENVCF